MYPPQPDNSLTIWRGSHRLYQGGNLCMRRSVLLLAQCLKDPSSATGVTHLAFGSGIGNGTLMLPQAPIDTRTVLWKEEGRVAVTSVSFDDLSNDEGDTITDGTTSNRIMYHTEIASSVSEVLITEVGLFGGSGASAANGGIMVAHITFPVLDNRDGGQDPDAPQDLIFRWRLGLPFINPEELVPA